MTTSKHMFYPPLLSPQNGMFVIRSQAREERLYRYTWELIEAHFDHLLLHEDLLMIIDDYPREQYRMGIEQQKQEMRNMQMVIHMEQLKLLLDELHQMK